MKKIIWSSFFIWLVVFVLILFIPTTTIPVVLVIIIGVVWTALCIIVVFSIWSRTLMRRNQEPDYDPIKRKTPSMLKEK